MKKLDELIKKYRELRKISLGILATAAGVSKEYIRLLENGKIKDPSIFIIFRIANILKIPSKYIIKIAKSQVYDLSEIAESIVDSVSLILKKQKILFEFGENRILELIKFTQSVSNPSIKKPISKCFHSLRTFSGKGLNNKKIYPLENFEYYESGDGFIDFFFIFSKALKREDGFYEYSWWTKDIDMFKEEFKNFDKFKIGGPFRWTYYPTRTVNNLEIDIKHPKDYEIAKIEFIDIIKGGIVKKFLIEPQSDDIILTKLKLGEESKTNPLKAGLYELRWWYKIK